jgi:uncharacterized membrane protein (DUF2068 family)
VRFVYWISEVGLQRRNTTASRRVLRLIAAFKFLKAAVSVAGGIGALRLLSPDRSARTQTWLEQLVLERGHHLAARLAERALYVLDLAGPNAQGKVAVGAFLLATLFIVEGVGLALARRWAEYLTAAVMTSFLPVEAAALWHRWTLMRAGTIALNAAIVVYLLVQIRAGRGSHRG